ncbi:MAG: hypothetical protein KDD25_05520 [Bdellovibrionales bacterium]|nr:hypothetical protein [Bdellovibrionales bacterium]
MIFRILDVFVFGVLCFTPQFASAGACCGTGSSIPALITGDFKTQLNTSYSYFGVVGDVDKDGEAVFRSTSNKEYSQTFQLQASHMWSEYWQTGVSLPLIRKTRQLGEQKSTVEGLGDVSAVVSFEFLPELEYSKWKPRGFTYFKLTAPTAPSIYNFQDDLAADARGAGFWETSIGGMFSKVWGRWDSQAFLEVGYFHSRKMAIKGQDEVTYSGSGKVAASIGGGYSFLKTKDLRWGASINPSYTGEKQVSDNRDPINERLVWSFQSGLGYVIDKEWFASLNYTDETLIGPVRSAPIGRSVGLNLSYRWPL